MPAPMPPQAPPPGAPPQGQDPQGQGGGPSPAAQLMMGIAKALDHLNQAVQQSPATSPQEKQMIGQIQQMFGKFMSSVGQGDQEPDADDAGPGGGQGQTVPVEAGGNKKAVPVG